MNKTSKASIYKSKLIVNRYELNQKINNQYDFWKLFNNSTKEEKQKLKKNKIYIEWLKFNKKIIPKM